MKLKILSKKNLFSFEIVFMILCSILPLIDTLNGFLNGNSFIGSSYKLIILCTLGYGLYNKRNHISNKAIKIICNSLVYITFTITCNIVLFQGKLISNSFPIKLVFNILLFVFIYELTRIHAVSKSILYSILNNTSWVFIFCLLVPYFLGVGNTIYAHGVGYKGFFISQNELSFVLLVLCMFNVYRLIMATTLSGVIQLVLIMFCGILINTKSALLGCVFCIFIFICLKLKQSDFRTKIIILIIFFLTLIIFKSYIYNAFFSMFDRFSSLKLSTFNGSFFSAILSGRNLYFKSALDFLYTEHTFFRVIFGNGFCSKYLIEMDFLDIFFYLGIIGEIALIMFLLRILKKFKSKTKEILLVKNIFYLIMVAYMFITGHVVFYAMSGTFFVLFACFLISD